MWILFIYLSIFFLFTSFSKMSHSTVLPENKSYIIIYCRIMGLCLFWVSKQNNDLTESNRFTCLFYVELPPFVWIWCCTFVLVHRHEFSVLFENKSYCDKLICMAMTVILLIINQTSNELVCWSDLYAHRYFPLTISPPRPPKICDYTWGIRPYLFAFEFPRYFFSSDFTFVILQLFY